MARRSSIRSGTTKSLIYSVLCILFGAILIVGGVMTWKDPADCGGQTMQQGDTCEVTQDGSTTDNGLSQQESSNHRDAVIMFVLGPLMIIGGALWLGSEIRIRQRRGSLGKSGMAFAGAGPFPGPGQAPPQMYNPGQAMGQNPYAAPGQQQYGAAQPSGFPQQQQQQQYGAPQQQPQQQYVAPQQQQYGSPPPQAQPQPQPQAYGAPPQQGWPGQQGQPGQQPQQGGWSGN